MKKIKKKRKGNGNFAVLFLVSIIALGTCDLVYGGLTDRGPILARALTEVKAVKQEQKLKSLGAIAKIDEAAGEQLEKKSGFKVSSENDALNAMHKMANTKIIADAVSGEIEITTDRVDYLLWVVGKSDFKNRQKLLDILQRWKDGKFDQADKEHDFLLRELGGTIGFAKGIKQ